MIGARARFMSGLWLIAGGVLILTTYQLLALSELTSLDAVARSAGAIAGYAMLGGGVYVLARVQRAAADATPSPAPARANAGASTSTSDAVAHRLVDAYADWRGGSGSAAPVWPAFEQFVREQLFEHLGAPRVRCYHVDAEAQLLRPLVAVEGDAGPAPLAIRAGLLGHVAVTGRAFRASDAALGELVHELAAADPEAWQLAWPVREGDETIGLIAAAQAPLARVAAVATVETLLNLLATFWTSEACRQRLRAAEHLDKATGVLTRGDFFSAAERAVRAANDEREPVVVAVLAVEGVRGLDDRGAWRQRDALIERIGHVVAQRVRTDDLVGRFADDRFVLFLRRLDGPLGVLVMRKMVAAVRAHVPGEALRLRVGLADAPTGGATLPRQLAAALEATDAARHADKDVELGALAADAGVTPV